MIPSYSREAGKINLKFINDITNFIFLSDAPQKSDIIFIPGGSYPEIAEKAALLWKEGYSKTILPSGKYSIKRGYFPGASSKANFYSGDYSTEWEFLKNVLANNGVDENSILREDQATNTYENAIYSRKVTDANNLNIQKAIICCKAFHARRCLMYYQLLYPDTQFLLCPAQTHGLNKENWFMSDEGIRKVLGELARCGNQFVDILKDLMAAGK
ncbi:MAG: YdcF family protein [Thermoclostridium sp.]|nr:YdcF family protein [Thermoclostridium sp.]